MASGQATVKAIPSGDTLVLIGSAAAGPPPELQITLSSIQAPRIGRQGGTVDEPFAWQSRDFLRSKCIGKTVQFQVEYRVASIDRDFGCVKLDGENLGKAVVRQGWAKVKPAEQSRDGQSQDYDELVLLENQAQTEKVGMWTDDPVAKEGCVRNVTYADFDSDAILNEFKGIPVKSVIEHIRDGSSFRVLLLPNWTVVNFMLSGVQCPRVNTAPRVDPTTGQPVPASEPEPFAREAKHFTEIRLLHREVDVLLEGVDKYGNFYGTVCHPQGNISVEILRHGLGKMVDWSSAFCSRETAGAMRNAERQAKLGQMRLWRGWVPPTITGDKDFNGTIIEVVSGDTVVVKVGDDPMVGEERRVTISSIRAPRVGNARRNQPDEPYAVEAKDMLRQRLIGREVSVSVEYMRDMPTGNPEEGVTVKRPFGTIIVGKGGKARNVGEMMVGEGLASVIRHRQDEERSLHYEALLTAEQQAMKTKKGMHKGTPPPVTRVTDLTQNKKQAIQYLPFLQRQRTVKAYIDYVFAGSRFKVYIPKENCAVMFALTTVRAPQPSRAPDANNRGGRKGDAFGDEAKNFSRLKLMQRNVEIDVVDMDRNGVALGTLFIGSGEQRHDYAMDLLEAGLAKLDDRALERMGGAAYAFEAKQDVARTNKIGIWSVENSQETSSNSTSEELMTIRIADIVDGCRYWMHISGDDGLQTVEEEMRQVLAQHGTAGAPSQLKKGSLVAALFDDGSGPSWYRAKVLALDQATTSATMLYIDHGNSAQVAFSKTRPLPPTVTAIPAAAKEAKLAVVKAPQLSEDYGRDAGMAFSEFAWGRDLIAKVYGRDADGRLRTVLYDGENPVSVNESMVQMGLCRIDKSEVGDITRSFPTAQELVEQIENSQQAAKKSRANIWRYGDVDSDEEDVY
mmetsp:Transcript_28764/g.37765  ORF Transcript_28764/g.37765 Transcript_28764/m.37765 type:complete len:904 (+) Transcript_28764:127-2838(+)|eukprot:CAMPEP_0117764348 /NCGR_PEP_ID=MMETSP0947-20121206/19325_1 /TAXON_ID=44440 /ORGANISM="Chattonella subsalsa, Strain CCMP2191" /LENGTH=903 /DNA_ID=CAMNT_0005586519 /DNA_START=118 /DNA_END=2829 /DNA_ORIENTATION=+